MPTLDTPRLILRPLTASDSADLFAARSDDEVLAFWDGPPDADFSETAAIVSLLLADGEKRRSRDRAARVRISSLGLCAWLSPQQLWTSTKDNTALHWSLDYNLGNCGTRI